MIYSEKKHCIPTPEIYIIKQKKECKECGEKYIYKTTKTTLKYWKIKHDT